MKPCPNCFIAIIEPHPELHWWFKCPTCGFCCIDMSLIHIKDREKALKNPFAPSINAVKRFS